VDEFTKIPKNGVDIWLLDPTTVTDNALIEQYHPWLNQDEQARWERFKFAKDKHQHLLTRALLRSTLSRYYPQITPVNWEFSFNSHGKPTIANTMPTPLYFNLSHCLNRVTLAVTHLGELGIDVEKIKPVDQLRGLAERCFTAPERDYILQGARRQENISPAHLQSQEWRFFKLWTLKEAYIKACGKGLSIPLDSFSFDPLAHPICIDFMDDQIDSTAWIFKSWQISPDHLLSLAIKTHQLTRIRFLYSIPSKTPKIREFDEIAEF
jgi:4'-phosphopantetheinyl transferase